MNFCPEERETVITTDDACDYWTVFSRQRKVCSKIRKIPQVEIISEISTGTGTVIEGTYRIPFKCVRFVKIRELSTEARKKASERMKGVAKG